MAKSARTSTRPSNRKAASFNVRGRGENVSDREEPQARLIGEHKENELIDSEDDEEIDSDGAFEESDEEGFAGSRFLNKGKKQFTKKQKSSKSAQSAEVDLNEDEEMDEVAVDQSSQMDEDEDIEEDGDPDDFIDVLDVLDGKGEVDDASDAGGVVRKEQKIDGEENNNSKDEEDEEGDEESGNDSSEDSLDFAGSDVDDPSPQALNELQSFISGLDTSRKRKAPSDVGEGEAPTGPIVRKRRIIKDKTEGGAENEFRAQASGSKLKLDDLLAPLASQSSNLASLKKSAKVLASKSSSIKTLAAPLPHRTQERLDREAAYEQTKEEVDKWKATMKRIKEADHLSFPLQAQPTGRVSNLELIAKFKPTTELESSVDKLLKSANLREEEIEHTEALQMKHLSVEEVAARRGELRKMRELMFRAEVKAKRVAKIKSKTYKRIKKKEKLKMAERLDGDDEGEEGEEDRLKREVDRARERATLRHKNTGKWARAMKAKGELDVDERREISEMLERGERLRQKIRGSDGEEGDDDSVDDDGRGDLNGGLLKVKQGAFEEISRLEEELGETAGGESIGNDKSIFGMKFMKDAMARSQHNANRMVDDFIKEMGNHVDNGSDPEGEGLNSADDVAPPSGIVVERTGGRMIYRPGGIPTQVSTALRTHTSLASDTSSVTLKSTDVLESPPPPLPTPIIDEQNPWLVPRDDVGSSKAPRKKNEVVVGKESGVLDKSANKLKKRSKKTAADKEKEKDDAVVDISMDNVLELNSPSKTVDEQAPDAKQKSGGGRLNDTTRDSDSDVNSEVEEQEKLLDLKRKGKARAPRAFEQRDLVTLAFAGDNVVQNFEDAKRREIAADAPREVDTTLPGWGSWGGTGTRSQPPKPHLIKKIAGVGPSSRADFNKKHVIISEKRDKKAAKYLVKDLPYPYTSKAQYERSMDQPIGTEWNTRIAFQRATLPKVIKKMGTVIDPLEKLF